MRHCGLLTLLLMICLSVFMPAQPIDGQENPPTSTASEAVEAAPVVEVLHVTEVLPAHMSTNVASNTAITVVFNRPVVPLSTSINTEILNPLIIDPPIAGQGEWVNTSIYVFRPSEPYLPNQEYMVVIPAGLTSVDGAVLPNGFLWGFTTSIPSLMRIMAGNEEHQGNTIGDNAVLLLKPTFWFYFSQSLEPELIESALYVRPFGQRSGSVQGTIRWYDDINTIVTFTPDELLTIDTAYTVGIDLESLPANTLTVPADRPSAVRFRTVPLPSIVSTEPADGATDVPGGSFVVRFASPMDAESIFQRITFDPQPERMNEYYQGSSYMIAFVAAPRTTYTVTLPDGMRDLYGNVIEEGRTITFTTAPPGPHATLNIPGMMGFFNAYNPDTGLYLTHRNVESVDLNLYTLRTEDFVQTILQENYHDFVPSSERMLRSWTVHLQGEIDQSIPHYLSLGDSDTCLGAPESRVGIGTFVQVAPAQTAAQVFDAPAGNRVIAYLYPNMPFPVIGGSICEDRVRWWEVEIAPNTTAWVAETNRDGYVLEPEPPLAESTIPIRGVDNDALAAGVYLLRFRYGDVSEETYAQQHFMMVMTANLTVKASVDEVLVWATDVQSGLPIPDAPITIYSQGRGVVAAGVTDSDGLLRVSVPPISDLTRSTQLAVLQTADHLGIGSTRWADGIDPGNFGYQANYAPQQYRVFAYTDRPIYRPGQTAYFRAVVRRADDMAYFPPDLSAVPVQVRAGDNVLFSREVPLSRFGTLSGSFVIPDDAYGGYELQVTIPTAFERQQEGTSVRFSILEYRLPEFVVSVTPITQQVAQNDTIQVLTAGRYFFDAPVSDARVEYRALAQPYFFSYRGEGHYQFYDASAERDPRDYGRVLFEEEGQTDARGEYQIEFPAELIDTERSQVYTIEATLHDRTVGDVSEQTQVIVHAGLLYVGGQPENYVGRAGEPMNINLIAVDWDSVGIPDQPIELEVVERRFNSVQEMDSVGRTTWTHEIEEIPITDGEVMTGNDGTAVFTFTPPNGGSYRIRLSTRDSAGNAVQSAVYTWVASAETGEYVSWQPNNSRRIDLIADQDLYHIGDTAEVLITSPFQGEHQALITVERGGIFAVERVTMRSNTYIYRVPITSQHVPNVYVSVMLVKGVDATNPISNYRMGLVRLNVDASQRQINVEILSEQDRAQPNEHVTFTVRTTDANNQPVAAELGVALTDTASLSLIQPDQRDLMTYFYSQMGLGVRTGTVLTMNTDYYTQYIMDMIKGGGGGGSGVFIRENFVDTPYWEGHILTDSDGEATFTIALPDNLTTWHLDVRALTEADDGVMLVGQNTRDLVSTMPLMVRPVTPRFFVVDDVVTLGAVVNNNTQQPMTVDVTLNAEGLTTTQDRAQQVTIPPDGMRRVDWEVTVENVESVDVVMTARDSDGQYTDAARSAVIRESDGRLPVYRYIVPETVGTSGILREAGIRTETLAIPATIDPTRGDLTVRLQTSLAAVTLDGLGFLRNYPHQCVEQTVSRFLPNIITYRALNNLGISDNNLQAALYDEVTFAVGQLATWQMVDGGWGWFRGNESNPLTTAYALIALHEARNIGLVPEPTMVTRAQAYLSSTMIVPGIQVDTWQINRQAFVLYALAYTGAPDVARTATLYEWRERLNVDAQAFLLMALHLIDPEDTRIQTLRAELISDAVMSATGTHWEENYLDFWNWSTDIRTTAIALKALIQVGESSELLPNAVRWLVTMREQLTWETTQQTAWAVMALTDWMVATGELGANYPYSVSLNNAEISAYQAAPEDTDETTTLVQQVTELMLGANNALTFERGDGVGSLYYTAHLTAYLPVPEVQPLEAGIILQRQYLRHDPLADPETPPEIITEAVVGEIVEVRLTVIAPDNLHYVVIEDPLPAGMELMQRQFMVSQQLGTYRQTRGLLDNYGSWYFRNGEYLDEKVVLYASYLPAGTYEYRYLVRAGIPGTYNVIPPTGQEFYFPEVYGRGAGSVFTVTASG